MSQIEIGPRLARTLCSIAICAAGGFCMWLTNGATGIGWAVLGLLIVWGS